MDAMEGLGVVGFEKNSLGGKVGGGPVHWPFSYGHVQDPPLFFDWITFERFLRHE